MVTANSVEKTETMSPEVAETVVEKVDVAGPLDPRARILDLLSDQELFGNLLINPEDPIRGVEEFLDGTWYPQTLSRLQQEPNQDTEFILPVILYLDKTGTSDWQHYPLEPVVFTNIDP